MEGKFFFVFSYVDDAINLYYTSFRNKDQADDFFPGMRVSDYFCIKDGFWVIDRSYNLDYVMKCFDNPERLTLLPCGFDLILCLKEDEENIKRLLWKIIKTLKNENCFFRTGDLMLDTTYDPTIIAH